MVPYSVKRMYVILILLKTGEYSLEYVQRVHWGGSKYQQCIRVEIQLDACELVFPVLSLYSACSYGQVCHFSLDWSVAYWWV